MIDKIKMHKNICDSLNATYKAKNHDYGDSWAKSIDEWGSAAAMVRMSDKWNRINTLVKNGGENLVCDEKIRDTCLDLANYLVMFVLEMDIKGAEDFV